MSQTCHVDPPGSGALADEPCSVAEEWDADTHSAWPDEPSVNLIDHRHQRAYGAA
jgi:hypothetical protein